MYVSSDRRKFQSTRQLLNLVKKGTEKTGKVETMIFPILKLVEMLSVACIFQKDFGGWKGRKQAESTNSVVSRNKTLCIKSIWWIEP